MAKGYITRKRTWINKKTGEIVTKQYYYERSISTRKTKTGKTIKTTYKRVKPISRQERVLSRQQIEEFLEEKSADYATRQTIINELKGSPIEGDLKPKTFTRTQLEARFNKYKSDKTSTLLRNLGFSEEDFAQTTGISVSDIRKGTFEKIGNDIRYTSPDDNVYYFVWDYDGGFYEQS